MIGTFLPQVPEIINNVNCNHVPINELFTSFRGNTKSTGKINIKYQINSMTQFPPIYTTDKDFIYILYRNRSTEKFHIKKISILPDNDEIWEVNLNFATTTDSSGILTGVTNINSIMITTDDNSDIIGLATYDRDYYIISKDDGSIIASGKIPATSYGKAEKNTVIIFNNNYIIWNYYLQLYGNVLYNEENITDKFDVTPNEQFFTDAFVDNNLLYCLVERHSNNQNYPCTINVYDILSDFQLIKSFNFTYADYVMARCISNLNNEYLIVTGSDGSFVCKKDDFSFISSKIPFYFKSSNSGTVSHYQTPCYCDKNVIVQISYTTDNILSNNFPSFRFDFIDMISNELIKTVIVHAGFYYEVTTIMNLFDRKLTEDKSIFFVCKDSETGYYYIIKLQVLDIIDVSNSGLFKEKEV